MRSDLPQSRAVLCVERCGHAKERFCAHKATAHAVVEDKQRQPKLLLNLCGPHYILMWPSVEAESSKEQAKVTLHRAGRTDATLLKIARLPLQRPIGAQCTI